MNDTLYVITVFLAMGAVTFAERALPFVASRWLKNQAWVRDVGSFLPLAVMVLLVLSSGAGFAAGHTGLPWQGNRECASHGSCAVVFQKFACEYLRRNGALRGAAQ